MIKNKLIYYINLISQLDGIKKAHENMGFFYLFITN